MKNHGFCSTVSRMLQQISSREGLRQKLAGSLQEPTKLGPCLPLAMGLEQLPAGPLLSVPKPVTVPNLLASRLLSRSLTWLDVFSDDGDMLVSVWPSVFMPEPNHVAQLMSHNSKLVTVFPNGYGLGASSSASHIGATAGRWKHGD